MTPKNKITKPTTMKNALIRISSLRKQLGYSYENMAQELKITPSAYRKIELGITKLTLERLYEIASVLKSDISCFLIDSENLTQSEESPKTQINIDKVISLYEQRLADKDDQIQLLRKIIDKRLAI